MSVAPVNPVAAALATGAVGPPQSLLNAVVETVALAESAVLLELAAADPAAIQAGPGPQANPLAQAVDAARTAAAVRQGSLAPLLADLTQAAAAPALPAALKAAVSQVLALQLPTDAPVTAQALKQAVAQSGLFLEAHLAAAAAPGSAAPPPLDLKGALLVLQRALAAIPAPSASAGPASATPLPLPDRPAAPTPSQAQSPGGPLTVAVLKQAVAQLGPALEARLPAPTAAAQPAPTPGPQSATGSATAAPPPLPEPVKAAILQLVTQQLPPGAPPSAAAIRQAVAQAGALLDTHLADPNPAGPPPTSEDAAPELKTALRILQRALDADTAASPEPRVTVPPPPPHRQAAPTAQAPARATLPPDAEPPAIAQHLRDQVAQAVARQTLHQLASLPDGRAPAWVFELPLATPQGAAVAQFVIDRDGESPGGDADRVAPAWRARFSIDIEPLGPVHVHLRMAGDKTAVTVWAERPESLEALRGEGGALARTLPADVTFRRGAPSGPTPPSGRFVDQTS